MTRDQVSIAGPITLDGTSAGGDGLDISGDQDGVQDLTITAFSGAGISISGNDDTITGSLITGNQNGIVITAGGTANTIGGTVSGAGNVIVRSQNDGIELVGAQVTTIQDNWIGTDPVGDLGLGNGRDGIDVSGGATANTIGGTVSGAGNTIAFNGGNGVTIGSSPSDVSTGDAVLQNAIYGNARLAIDLGDDGVTLDDSEGHSGPNRFQDFPILSSLITNNGTTTIDGSLAGSPNTTYRVEFFSNAAADPSGYGQGQSFLRFANETTDSTGLVSFSLASPVAVPFGEFITATATDPSGNTSEFSPDIPVADVLSGEVYIDTNGDGSLDNAEPGLSGVTVELLNGAKTVVDTATTDAHGDYLFDITTPGTYEVEDVLPSGWVQTAPASASYTEALIAGSQGNTNLNFGDFQTVTLGGEVFNDSNGDGRRERRAGPLRMDRRPGQRRQPDGIDHDRLGRELFLHGRRAGLVHDRSRRPVGVRRLVGGLVACDREQRQQRRQPEFRRVRPGSARRRGVQRQQRRRHVRERRAGPLRMDR